MDTSNSITRIVVFALGAVLGLLIGLNVNRAHAAGENPLLVVETLFVGYNYGSVQKIYDNKNGVVCYTYVSSDGSGISCVK